MTNSAATIAGTPGVGIAFKGEADGQSHFIQEVLLSRPDTVNRGSYNGTASAQIVAANPLRKSLLIQNLKTSNATLRVALSDVDAATVFDFELEPGDKAELPASLYGGLKVNGCFMSTPATPARWLEMT